MPPKWAWARDWFTRMSLLPCTKSKSGLLQRKNLQGHATDPLVVVCTNIRAVWAQKQPQKLSIFEHLNFTNLPRETSSPHTHRYCSYALAYDPAMCPKIKRSSYASYKIGVPRNEQQSELWRRWVVVELRAVVSISFVLKFRQIFKTFLSYRCWTKWSEERITKIVYTFATAHFCV